MNSKTLVIYRTKNACQFQPDFERGIVWVGFADARSGASGPPKAGEQRYEWKQKITLALSVEEVTNLALAAKLASQGKLTKPLSFYHDPAKSTRATGAAKMLSLLQTDGGKSPAFLSAKQGDRKISVPLSHGDLFRLERLLPIVAAGLLGWIARTRIATQGKEQ